MHSQQRKRIAKPSVVTATVNVINLSEKKWLKTEPLFTLQIKELKYHFAHIFLIANITKANAFIL